MSVEDRKKRIIELLTELRKELMRPASKPLGVEFVSAIDALIREIEEEMDIGVILGKGEKRGRKA